MGPESARSADVGKHNRDPDAIECTVGILTFNSIETLGRTLEATRDFAERIVCDGGSTDGTRELAEAHGCTVLTQSADFRRPDNTLRDYAGAMRQLIMAGTMPWFFKVDSDEIPSVELVDELRRTLGPDCRADGFMVPLKYVVGGRVVADAMTYPMKQLRVVRVDSGLTYEGHVHEHIDTDGHAIEELQHPQLLPQATVRKLVPRWWRYLKIEIETARPLHRSERWTAHARPHLKVAKFLAWRYTKVLRGGLKPRLPLRYEALRVTNHLVGAVVLLAAGQQPKRRS